MVKMNMNIESFQELSRKYNEENNSYEKTLLFRVGEEGGLFSELNNMLIAMCYCHVKKIRFVLYADDANFTGGRGWTEIFDPFCQMNHDSLNKYGNYRHRSHFRFKRVLLPNLLVRKAIIPRLIKSHDKVEYLTQDVFSSLVSSEVLNMHIKWELFGMDGKIRDEFVKLRDLALHYNDTTRKEIDANIRHLNLPNTYISCQIRGGDKTAEYDYLPDADYCCEIIKRNCPDAKSIFVFTDDYSNIDKIRNNLGIKVYTLCKPSEKGYYNEAFNLIPWENRKADIIKVFSMMEICMHSDMHFGYTGACTNDFLSKAIPHNRYVDMHTNGGLKEKNLKYYVQKFFKFR